MKQVRFLVQVSLCVGIFTFFCLVGMIGANQAHGDPGAVFSLGPAMNVARMSHSIANLPDGKVAVFGGHGTNFVALGSSELWDPATNSFSLINMNSPRDSSAIAKLQDGRLLLAGGAYNLGVAPGNNTAEIFDPATSSFELTGSMTYGRTNCNAATLTSGKALIAGGWYDTNSGTYADLFDPNTGSFAMTGPLNSPRAHPVVLPTSDDKAVILGGMGIYGTPYIEMVELFDPSTNTFSVLQENLFVGETGWNILGFSKRPIEAQKLYDGRYILLAWRSAESVSEYTLFTFDPQTKEITKLISTPALPTSDSAKYYDAPMVDPTGSKVYLLALINPPSDPYQYKLFAINTTTGELTIPDESCPLPAADWYLSYAAATVLPEGRLFFTGGTSRQDSRLNFYPVTKTLFALPSVTSVAPTVSTTVVSYITSTTAQSGGHITSDGGADITARGVCWGTSANPTTANSKTTNGTGTGSFSSSITGLTAGTTYHVRAYATNGESKTGYGEDRIFETSDASTSSYVSSDGNCGTKDPCYTKIQDAIDAAATGSVILVKQGTYAESLSVGSGKTLLIKGGYDSVDYDQQTANTTVVNAPGATTIKASSGSLKFQMINVKTKTSEVGAWVLNEVIKVDRASTYEHECYTYSNSMSPGFWQLSRSGCGTEPESGSGSYTVPPETLIPGETIKLTAVAEGFHTYIGAAFYYPATDLSFDEFGNPNLPSIWYRGIAAVSPADEFNSETGDLLIEDNDKRYYFNKDGALLIWASGGPSNGVLDMIYLFLYKWKE